MTTKRKSIQKVFDAIAEDAKYVHPQFRSVWLSLLNFSMPRYWDLIDLLEQHGKANHCALEIGSFPGHLSVILKKVFFNNLHCIDIDPIKMQDLFARHNIALKKCDIEREPLPHATSSIDIILFTELLEHMRINILFTLREINRVLKPGGIMILSTPNITPINRFKFFLGLDSQEDPVKVFETYEKLGFIGHIRLYTENEARRLLHATGFTIKEVRYRGKIKWHKKLAVFPFYLLHPNKKKFRKQMYVVATKQEV